MKRSSSGSSHTPELNLDTKPHILSDTDLISNAEDFNPTTPAKKKAKAANKAATPKKEKAEKVVSPKKNRSDAGQGTGEWTPEIREAFMDLIIATGYKAANLQQVAADFGMSESQVRNQLTPGRKGNFREKAVKAVRGE